VSPFIYTYLRIAFLWCIFLADMELLIIISKKIITALFLFPFLGNHQGGQGQGHQGDRGQNQRGGQRDNNQPYRQQHQPQGQY
jgi:hypothetical protein